MATECISPRDLSRMYSSMRLTEISVKMRQKRGVGEGSKRHHRQAREAQSVDRKKTLHLLVEDSSPMFV